MCIYLIHIKEALESMSTDYIIESNSSNRYAERLFAYEFYHQFRNVMKNNSSIYQDLFLTGEQSKIYSLLHDGSVNDTPDLVLCDNMTSIGKKQEFLIEIKMKGNTSWLSDLPKLSEFANSSLSFKYHVFLYVGDNFSSIEEELLNKCRTIDNFSKEIYVVTCFKDKNRIKAEINIILKDQDKLTSSKVY